MKRLATVDDLRRDLETFGTELGEEDYQNAVGLKDEVDSAAIFERFAHLHAVDTLHFVKRACSVATDADEARRLRFLEMEVLGAVVGERFVEEEDALTTEESLAVVEVAGEVIPYRDLGNRIRNEDERPKRRALRDAEDGVAVRFLPRVDHLERRAREAVAALGYPDDATRWELQHGIPLAETDDRMARFIDDTHGRYARALAERLERVEGLPLAEAEGHDVSHMMRAKAFDRHFPKEDGVPGLHRFLKGLGFDVARMPNVKLDTEDRPNKDSRAFVMPSRVPDDVRLVTRPVGGVDDYRALWHESGHLLHYALTDPKLGYEDRYHGDGGVTESYAFLFEHLYDDPLFLEEVAPTLDGEEKRDYLRYLGLEKLMSLRYYGRSLRYDLWLAKHDGDPPASAGVRPFDELLASEAPRRYVAWMTDALKVPANPLDYLGTDGFYGMWYLRAWLFEAMHRRWLADRFGDRWWREPDAGKHLAALYRRGSKPTVEDLARDLGYGEITMRPLLEDVDRLLKA